MLRRFEKLRARIAISTFPGAAAAPLALAAAVAAALVVGCSWEERDLGEITCGNGACDAQENPATCATDCPPGTCGNHRCELTEDGASCPADCSQQACGDGVCDEAEHLDTCPGDCPWASCGNGVCEAGEDAGGCAEDCFVPGCGNGVCELRETTKDCAADCPVTRAVDLLFVIDNSGSMADEQALLASALSNLLEHLRIAGGEVADIQVGVTSTDLGVGPNQITYCEDIGGDGGDLLASPEAGLQGVPFLIDEAPLSGPQGCEVTRDGLGHCVDYLCGAQPCATRDGSYVALVEDVDTGCPRCRNFAGSPAQVLGAMAQLGTLGCGFEQPLEAMYRALDDNPHNAGFVRDDALLAVVFVTDEDDCSASTDQLFDNTQTRIDSTLGPFTSFRCFEFGVTCDINRRLHQGLRQDCHPRAADGTALLYPIRRYRDALLQRKDPGRIVMMALAGPLEDLEAPSAVVGRDDYDQPMLVPSCSSARGQAVPAIRLWHLVQHFTDVPDASPTFHSICNEIYENEVEVLAGQIRRRLEH
jgi:uncharacterized protein YfcZ (UPF0381/DUF406 family)